MFQSVHVAERLPAAGMDRGKESAVKTRLLTLLFSVLVASSVRADTPLIETKNPVPVPDSVGTVLLLGAALTGVAVMARRLKK